MADSIYDTVAWIAGEILGQDPLALDPDAPIGQLLLDDDDFHEILKRAAAAHEVNLNAILNTLPVYRIERGEDAMAALRNLGAFSGRAREILARHTVCIELDTLRSIAWTIEAGKYVASGQTTAPLHEPATIPRVLLKLLALWGPALAVPLAWGWGPCNPVHRNCFMAPQDRFWTVAQWTLPAAAAVMFLLILPGLLEMLRAARKDARRIPSNSDRV